jgi:hypothetical protein
VRSLAGFLKFGGDHRAVIRSLLHDLTELALDTEAVVSKIYVRGRQLPFKLPGPA